LTEKAKVLALPTWTYKLTKQTTYTRHNKDVIQMVPDAFLLSAQHIKAGLAFLSSQTSFKNKRDGYHPE